MASYFQASVMIEKLAADTVTKGLEELVKNLAQELTKGISYIGYGCTVSDDKIAHIVAFSNQIEAIHSLIGEIKNEFAEEEVPEEATPF